MKCGYCQVNANNSFFQDINEGDDDEIMQKYKDTELILSGRGLILNSGIFCAFGNASIKRAS